MDFFYVIGTNVVKKNSIRVAEVWMDDYKKYYYERFNFDLVSDLHLSYLTHPQSFNTQLYFLCSSGRLR